MQDQSRTIAVSSAGLESRVDYYRRLIPFLERNAELRGLLDTYMAVAEPREHLEYTTAGARVALNTDYLKLAHFGACYRCFQPVAVMPDRLVDWPLREHECREGIIALRRSEREGKPNGKSSGPATWQRRSNAS